VSADCLVGLCQTIKNPNCTNVKECVTPTDCDDNNKCTIENCTADSCKWTAFNCTTQPGFAPDMCSEIVCDPIQGCLRNPFADDYCDDGSNCTIDRCDPLLGCINDYINCSDGNNCTIDTCDKINGCQFVPKECSLSNNTCKVSFCNETTGECDYRDVACGFIFPKDALIGATIGGAALVGVIIAAVICAVGLAGGGAYAVVQAQAGPSISNVQSNPIYQGAGNDGVNPLYKA